MTSSVITTESVEQAAAAVPEQHYTRNVERGATIHTTAAQFVHRDISSMDIAPGMSVLEIGTGSGYSGALLSELVGESGHVTSLDIDHYLTTWANVIHAERGRDNIRCITQDGTAPLPGTERFDRIGAWCTPPLLPREWVDRLNDGGLIVAALPVVELPDITVVATVRVTSGVPEIVATTPGTYIDATSSPKRDVQVPDRWLDWEYRYPEAAWISVNWRAGDDWRHTAARRTLDRLVNPGLADVAELPAWGQFRFWAAAGVDAAGLTLASLPGGRLAVGHSTPDSVAVVTGDGRLLADSPDSASLAILRSWMSDWVEAATPHWSAHTPYLVTAENGWRLRLSRTS
ncbi:protein-L-isoaspartate O-methyltransferase family protein [Streptomyces xiamenensis]|uniref:protein-L-isoaspartate O-methyltransferase family protein n=1 Tax=Streptomyces xiamenensis TaxID=408015 RepID=UPI0035DF3519